MAGQTDTAAVHWSIKPKKGVNQIPVPFSTKHKSQKQAISKPQHIFLQHHRRMCNFKDCKINEKKSQRGNFPLTLSQIILNVHLSALQCR